MKVIALNKHLPSSDNPQDSPEDLLQNISVKDSEFNKNNIDRTNRIKNLRSGLPQEIFYNGINRLKIKNNCRMLPEIHVRSPSISQTKNYSIGEDSLKSVNMKTDKKTNNILIKKRNSDLLNSIIQILKTDPDRKSTRSQIKNQRIASLPTEANQFLQCKQITSVKNSRGPKLVANQIMMLKRDLVSQSRKREKLMDQIRYSCGNSNQKSNQEYLKNTFYRSKPPKPLLIKDVSISSNKNHNTKKYQQIHKYQIQ